MNARFVTLVLLLFVWLEGDSVWAQYLPKLYQVFSPDKKLKMAIQRHNDGLLTYTFAALQSKGGNRSFRSLPSRPVCRRDIHQPGVSFCMGRYLAC